MNYRVRERTQAEIVRGGRPSLKWCIVPENQPQRVLRVYRTHGEALAALRYWKALVAPQPAKGGEYPPSL